MKKEEAMVNSHRDFRKQITNRFSLEEIKGICFDLSIPFDDIPGEHLSSKVNALLVSLYKLEKLEEFHRIIIEERPKIAWPNLDTLKNFKWLELEKSVSLPPSIHQQTSNSDNIFVGNRGVHVGGNINEGVIITGNNNLANQTG